MTCCHAAIPAHKAYKPSVGAQVTAAVLASYSMAASLATNLNPLAPAPRLYAHLSLLALALINLGLVGRPLLAAVWRTGLRSVAGLFVLGMAGALVFSILSTWRGYGPVYYEVVCILLVIYAVGRALTEMAQSRVLDALNKVTLHGAVCAVSRDGAQFVDMPLAAIRPGDAFVVRPGGAVVADGIVTSGTAFVQTASLTGESQLRRVVAGDFVLASWFCVDATLLIEATQPGTKRAIDAVAAAVAEAQAQPRGRLPQAEVLAARFVPIVMGVSLLTFAGWSYVASFDAALLNALAVCLVACPCAFGFAAPIGLRAATLRLAQAGVVVRNTEAFDALASASKVVFDKTGTLTATRLDAAQTVVCPQAGWSPDALLGLAACAQALVHHPISAAFAPWADAAPEGWQAVAAQLLPGCGISVAMVGPKGRHVVKVGDPALLLATTDIAAQHRAQAIARRGHKPLALLLDNACLGLFALTDHPFVPPEALIDALTERHIEVEVLSGDGHAAVRALGMPKAQAQLTPTQKMQHILGLKKSGRVCFVGDGVNDSAALAAADVAISMHAGADLSVEVSDLTLPAGQPHSLIMAIDVARQAMRLIRYNLFISMTYNAVGMTVAALGLLSPVGAALLMAASSFTVSMRSLAMLRPQQKTSTYDRLCVLVAGRAKAPARPYQVAS